MSISGLQIKMQHPIAPDSTRPSASQASMALSFAEDSSGEVAWPVKPSRTVWGLTLLTAKDYCATGPQLGMPRT